MTWCRNISNIINIVNIKMLDEHFSKIQNYHDSSKYGIAGLWR